MEKLFAFFFVLGPLLGMLDWTVVLMRWTFLEGSKRLQAILWQRLTQGRSAYVFYCSKFSAAERVFTL